MVEQVTPRAAGERISYAEAPAAVRAWVDTMLGSPVVHATTQRGGFSPGSAARLRTAGGRRAFVKAVGDEVNAQTPDLFRHESTVLSRLAAVPYRATLRGTYDDGTWVALLLDDVDGRHPDLHDDADFGAVRESVTRQTRELTPDPLRLDVPDMADTAARWHRTVARALAERPSLFPDWLVSDADALLERLASLPARLPDDSWVHLDIRDDNVLLDSEGTAVLLDWGMSRSGPAWIDRVLLAEHRVELASFDDEVLRIAEELPVPGGRARFEDDVTDFMLSIGASLAAIADRPPAGLPAIGEFRRVESARILAGVRRRLGR